MVDGVRGWLAAGAWIALLAAACSGNDVFGDPASAGAGGSSSAEGGGPVAVGAGASGGVASGGDPSGGSSAGGAPEGGSLTGGAASGGAGQGGSPPPTCGALTCTAGQACCNGTYCYPITCGVCCPGGAGGSSATTSGNGGGGGSLSCGGQLCQNGWNCCKVQAVEYCTPTACP